MSELISLPTDLPVPVDDGAADHLLGLALPDIWLAAAAGGRQTLNQFDTRWLVLYVYPRTGGSGIQLPAGWDLIPGARGCTPQACSFRDQHHELSALDATVWGVSAQPETEQAEFAERMHIPFPLLNDSELGLAGSPLHLPTFNGGDMTLYKRLTIIAEQGTIDKVFYPVFPPDENASEVIAYLNGRR